MSSLAHLAPVSLIYKVTYSVDHLIAVRCEPRCAPWNRKQDSALQGLLELSLASLWEETASQVSVTEFS